MLVLDFDGRSLNVHLTRLLSSWGGRAIFSCALKANSFQGRDLGELLFSPHVEPVDNKQKCQECGDDAAHGNAALLPVRGFVGVVESNSPKGVQHVGRGVHRIERNASESIVATSLANDVRPAEEQRVNDVGSAGKIESYEASGKIHVRDHQKHDADNLKGTSENAHWSSSSSCVDVEGGQQVGYDCDSLHSEGVRVDLRLREVLVVVLEEEQETILHTVCFQCGAHEGEGAKDIAVSSARSQPMRK